MFGVMSKKGGVSASKCDVMSIISNSSEGRQEISWEGMIWRVQGLFLRVIPKHSNLPSMNGEEFLSKGSPQYVLSPMKCGTMDGEGGIGLVSG